MSSVIFYGAGPNAGKNYDRWSQKGLKPKCFADADPAKHYTKFKTSGGEVEILPLLEATTRYPDYELFLTQNFLNVFDVRNYLIGIGVPLEKINFFEDFPLKNYERFIKIEPIQGADYLLIS